MFPELQKITRKKKPVETEKSTFLLARHLQSVCNRNAVKR